jgi:hypothetical protein
MPDFTIVAVSDRTRTWGDPPNGPFVSYRVDLKGTDGQTVAGAEWSRKQSSPAPTVGETVSGTLDMEAKFGPKFKQQAAFQGRGGGGPRPEDPKRAATILRQHSQEMSLRYIMAYLAGGGDFAKLVEADGKLMTTVLKLADVFDKDAKAAGERAA